MKTLELCLDGGRVLRYHAHPFASRQQSVAEHSIRAYWIAMFLAGGKLPVNVVHEILHHDVVEAITGDIPFTFKKISKTINEAVKKFELDVRVHHSLVFGLTKEEKQFVKFCDICERGIYAKEQIEQGNNKFIPILNNVIEWLDINKEYWLLNEPMGLLICYIKDINYEKVSK